jgi:putative component of membrane protein insertase Oxa1/YidC/SpoIIIJ protein YidD
MAGAFPKRLPRQAARGLIRAYQLTCSDYADEAIARHGLWAGGWMGLARICRCGPGGTSGLDFVAKALPVESAWYKPWRYARWRGVNAPAMLCEAVESDGGRS